MLGFSTGQLVVILGACSLMMSKAASFNLVVVLNLGSILADY